MNTNNKVLLAVGGAVLLSALIGFVLVMGREPKPQPSKASTTQATGQTTAAATGEMPLCGNGVLDSGETCDPADPATATDPVTGNACNANCSYSQYSDELSCEDQRREEQCFDADGNPVANLYDCIDAQHTYCLQLSY